MLYIVGFICFCAGFLLSSMFFVSGSSGRLDENKLREIFLRGYLASESDRAAILSGQYPIRMDQRIKKLVDDFCGGCK